MPGLKVSQQNAALDPDNQRYSFNMSMFFKADYEIFSEDQQNHFVVILYSQQKLLYLRRRVYFVKSSISKRKLGLYIRPEFEQ